MRAPLVTVDLDVCCRSGMCAVVAPDLVTQETDGTPVVLTVIPHGLSASDELALVDTVLGLCPVGALRRVGEHHRTVV